MREKRIIGWAVLAATLLFLGPLRVSVQAQSSPENTSAIQAESSYEAKVAAVRTAFATVRKALDLSNTSGQSSTPESDMGEPSCQNAGGSSGGGGGAGSALSASRSAQNASCMPSSKGAPVWQVNMVNLNFYMADTPLWYSSPIGPSVELKLSYNSQTSLSGPFGSKWQLNYRSYLYRAVDDAGAFAGIMVVMPDGKQDLYVPGGASGYNPPYHVFNTLTELPGNRFELKFPDGEVYVYTVPQGTTGDISFLTEMKDAYGQKLSMGYDANGKLTTITDALGKATTLSYNSDGLVIQAADPFGRTASFEYDANKNLAKITDMGGYWTSFTYRRYVLTDYYLESLTNAGGSWGFYFEPEDDLEDADPYPAPGAAMGYSSRITVTNPHGGKEEYYLRPSWYISPKNYIPYTNKDNNNYASNAPKTSYLLTATTQEKGEVGSIVSPEGDTTDFTYGDFDGSDNDPGNIASVSNGAVHVSLTYNTMGKITSITDSKNATTTLSYAANGVDLTGITNGLGTIALAYNGAHDVISSTDRSGNTKTITYNSYGQLESITDPLGTTTNYIYDTNYRLTRITRDGQILNGYTYDPVGRIQTNTDATGMTITYEYNSLNDIEKITYPDGRNISTTYANEFPHLVTGITDRGGLTTQYVHDASQNIIQIVNPAGGIIGMAYDANGNRIKLIDPKGQVTTFAYDKDNRLVRKTLADGTVSSYTYDFSTRIASYTGARNLSSYYGYDANNNLRGISYTTDQYHYTSPSMYLYDPYNRLTTIVDGAGTTEYGYNADSLVTSIDGPFTEDTLTFQHDNKGRVTGYALERGQTVSYTYDTLDRLTSIQGGTGVYSYTYSGASPLIQRLTRPNGSYTEYQYDGMNRLILIANKKSTAETISQYGYTYNAQDLRAGETATSGAPITSFINGQTTYSYDNVNELLGSASPAKTFSYDADGNTTQWDSPDGKTLTAVYDIENRLTSVGYEILAGMTYESYQETFEYKANGMMSQKEVEYSKYIHYPDNYVYDKKLVRYVGNGFLPLQERDKNNTVLREYIWGLSLGGGIGGLLSFDQGGQHYYYLYDGKGNVTSVIDGSQAVVAAYTYDPFGNLWTKTGDLDQPYQFSTKPYDQATGLSYFGKRFYSPSAGRWTTRDPIEEAGGLNLYGFVLNNPINYIDPTGSDAVDTVATESGKETAEKVIKKKLDLAVPKPRDCKELERLYKDQKKTTEEAVKPWWQKLLDIFSKSSDSMGGAENTTPPPQSPPPTQRPPAHRPPPMTPPGQNDWGE